MPDRLLICTDLDRTLIPNGLEPVSSKALPLFSKLVARPWIKLAYVTGRDKKLVKEAITRFNLPVPDYAVTDVGSTVYEIQSGRWIRRNDWDQRISRDWKNKSPKELAVFLSDLTQCELQEEEKQGLYKLSYYVPLDINPDIVVDEIQWRMKKKGLHSNTIWSVDEQKRTGLLDVLPASADKRKAIEFIIETESFDYTRTVFSGDSGNDLAVFLSPVKSILVANASSRFKSQVKAHMGKTVSSGHLYIARGGYLNMNGNYAAGILEGINHYFPELKLMD
ncbi:HAD-IIB family hydrolase [uncultured Desulfobacter sp.]|uniref:HAD-IIB family hydrolase n=1 Tax=uncultured Desulfobacter sp. TaxID=240139 RepID=UPI002AAB0F9D|nr:HAD-IIB family hydrolase [uncultured Desulfobacter sp.]